MAQIVNGNVQGVGSIVPYSPSGGGMNTFGQPVSQGGGSIVPTAPPPVDQTPKPVTAISSQTANQYVQDNNTKLANLSNKGTMLGADGVTRYADGSFKSAPDTSAASNSTTTKSDATPSGAYAPGEQPDPSDYTSYSVNGVTYRGDPAQNSLIQKMYDSTDSSTKAQIDSLTSKYTALIGQQTQINQSQQASLDQSLLMNGSSRYAQISSAGQSSTMMTYGLQKISDLENEENSQIAAAKVAQESGDNSILEKALGYAEDARKEKQAEAQKLNDQLIAQNQKIQDQKDQATKDTAIATVMSQGITDPQKILAELSNNGFDTINAKDIADAMDNLNPNAKAITDIMSSAAKNGAGQDVLSAIGKSTSVASALSAAGNAMIDPTSTLGQYQSYVKSAMSAGQTPLSYPAYLDKQKYNDAYATAAGSAAGKSAGTPTSTTGSADYSMFSSSVQTILKTNGFTGYNDGTQNLATQLVNGQIAPAELSKRTTGTSSYNDVLTAADKFSMATTGKHFDIAQADRDYKFATNTQTQNTLNYLGSLIGSDDGSGNFTGGNLNELISLSDARIGSSGVKNIFGDPIPSDLPGMSQQGFPALNNAKQWASLQAGDPEIAAYYSTLLEVSDQVAKVLQGGGSGSGTSDAKLNQAAALFQKGFTPDQMKAVASSLQGLLANRASSMVKDNPYLSDYAEQFGVSTNNGVTTTNQKIMQDEAVAEGKITTFYKSSTENKTLIDDIHKKFPDMSAQEVAQRLNIQ